MDPKVNTNPKLTEADATDARAIIEKIGRAYSKKVVGQDELRLCMTVALIAGGHVLLESVPGLAKTLAAKTIAEAANGTFSRIQCTPDLLPSDIIGTQIYNYNTGSFETKIGPVHSNFVLLDEINRSSAKTQSAMLEAMQEHQVTVGGVLYKMPEPFVVLATQNPIEQEGTYELPEAQLDRFLLKEIVNYPARDEELQILNYTLSGQTTSALADGDKASIEDIKKLQAAAKLVAVDDSIKNYIVNVVTASRNPRELIDASLARYVEYGISPRGAIALMQVAQALALIDGRAYVTPDDVKRLRYAALRHRIILNFEAAADEVHPEAIIDAIFNKIQTP
ncbi:MAG: MoxR family ATPase [Candidatus Saccharibacteria bacterium]|jgi:MoxR-like ATPase|nr:MoxR family ATPase [Candidatus Saccharibacteria bacterium]